MDLTAYENIPDLETYLQQNDISIPRLRGLRLMEYERALSKEEIEELIARESLWTAEDALCEYAPRCYELSPRTERLKQKYIIYEHQHPFDVVRPVGIRWDRLHGKRKKKIRFAIKKMRRDVERQYEMWNRYAGQPGVLYIHARLGGENWEYYGGREIEKKPWYLDRVDDASDCSYTDIYAKIKKRRG